MYLVSACSPALSSCISFPSGPFLLVTFVRPEAENWQDHWCPSYYPVVGNAEVCAGDTVRLKVTHSDLNIMFEVVGVDANPATSHDDHVQQGETGTAASAEISPGAYRGGRMPHMKY